MSENMYLENCIKALHVQKDIAFKEFSNTDLNIHEQRNEINTWQKTVIELMNKVPPKSHVRCLVIYENVQEHVCRITYEYSDKQDAVYLPSLMIKMKL